MQHTMAQDLGTQSAVSFHGVFSPFRKGLIHPVTRRAFLGAQKTDALNLKLVTNQAVQIHPTGDDIAAEDRRRNILNLKLLTEPLINLMREKGDLTFVVLLEAKKAVSDQPLSRHAFHGVHLHHRRLPGGFSVVAEEIVFW